MARRSVTADHGNCEKMWDDKNNCPHTAHTLNDTPCVVIAPEFEGPLRDGGALCDVAPTLLGLMGVPQPPEIDGPGSAGTLIFFPSLRG